MWEYNNLAYASICQFLYRFLKQEGKAIAGVKQPVRRLHLRLLDKTQSVNQSFLTLKLRVRT
jgi:hypothetical protein